MGLFGQFDKLTSKPGDQASVLLAKILERLNANASALPEFESGNVVVTNTPLSVSEVSPVTSMTVSNKPQVTLFDPDTNETAQISDGHLSSLAVDFRFEVAHTGSYGTQEASNFRIIGRRAGFNSTSILQDVGEFLGTATDLFPVLQGTEALQVVSSSSSDAAAGIGAHTVRIVYLDTSYDIQSVDVTLTGTVPVSLGAVRMLFVYWMETLTGGTSEVGVGNIDLRTVSGATVQERITAGGNRSLSCRFMVPDDHTAYIAEWGISAINTTQDARLRATVTGGSRALNSKYIFQDTLYMGNGQTAFQPLPYLRFPARCQVKVSTFPGAAPAGNRIDAGFNVLMIKN